MLQAIRDRVTGVVAFVILGLLAIPFLFFGVESYINTVPEDAVAVVGDHEITVNDFQAEFARHRARLRQEQGDQYDEVATNQPTVRREFLEEMIDQVLLQQHAASIGLSISDDALLQLIQGIEAFRVGNQFSPEAYRQALSAQGLTARGFEQEVREDLMTRTVPTAVTGSAMATEKEIDRMIEIQNEQREVAVIEYPREDHAEEVVVSDEDIADFYADNTAQFMTEERVSVRYVELKASDLTDGLTLSEEELRQRYEAAEARFLSPELRRASHILLEVSDERGDAQTEALAESLIEQIRAGEDFTALAEANSADPISAEQGGDLGLIEPGQMMPAFEQALYDLGEPGQLSDPVKTRFGWHVIRLDEIQPPEGLSFEEARDQIQAEYVDQESEARYIELSERLIDLIFADDSTLEPVSAELDLPIQTTEPFTQAGGEGLAGNSQIIEAAFSDRVLLDQVASDPIEIERNHMVVVILDEHFESEPKPLADVSDDIEQRLLRDAMDAAALQSAQEQLAAVNDNPSLADDLFDEPQTIGRNDFQYGPDFSRELFRLSGAGDDLPSRAVLPTASGYALIELSQVLPGNPAGADEQMRSLMRQQVMFAHIGYEINALMRWLRENTSISVVEDRL